MKEIGNTGGASEEVLGSLAAEVRQPHVTARESLTLGHPGNYGPPILGLIAAYFEADARAREAYSQWLLSRSEEDSQKVQRTREAREAAKAAFDATLRRDVAAHTWGEGVEPELKSSTHVESMCPVSYTLDRQDTILRCAAGTVIHTVYYNNFDRSVVYGSWET